MLSGKLTENSSESLRCRNGLRYEQNVPPGSASGGAKDRRNSDTKNNGRETVEGRLRGDREMRRGHEERSVEVETMDRGVGPSSFTNCPDPERRIPYFHIPPYLPEHHRTSGIDPAMSPYFYPHLPFFNQSLPVNSCTNEGRYQWPPAPSPFSSSSNLHPPPTGATPIPPELGPLRGGFGPESMTGLSSRLQWEQYHKAAAAAAAMHYGPLAMHHRARGGAFSPTSFTGIPYGFSPNNIPGGYPDGLLPGSPFSPTVNYPGHLASYPDQSTAANIAHLSGSLEAAMQASSHLAALGKSRKRALSHSPIEFGLDIDSLTRSSEGSLLVMSCGQASRSSSNASGSYGHLSAASLGVLSSGHNPFTHPLFRSNGSLPGSPFFNPMFYPGFLPPPPWHPGANGISPLFNPSSVSAATPPASTESDPAVTPSAISSAENQERMSVKERTTGQVSSTVPAHSVKSKVTVKNEEFSPQSDVHSDEMKASPESHNGGQPQEGEVDFYETNCHWKGCSVEFETQDELVKHLNHDHISASKKLFVCQWEGCVRDEKPFKAQYMLVVHMRRHTGEKPHRCSFESCNKAYSRLENLKTHLRSHTGEKPYLCEFPGCTKAFSNASDRAKHQNRTHSNAKPYMCKAPGCSKCYTDPSSLRKHVKTVHGADFYASKKHKGSNSNNNNSNSRNIDSNGYSTNGDRMINGSTGLAVNNNDRKPDVANYSNNSNSSDSSSVSSAGGGRIKVENCFGDFNATDNSPASTDLATDLECKMSPYFGSYSQSSCMSPEASGAPQNCDTSAPSRDYLTGSVGAPSGGENDDDIGSEFVLPAASVSVGDGGNVQIMRNIVSQGQRLKGKIQPRFSRSNIPTLPPLGTTRKGWSSSSRLSGVNKESRTAGLDGRAGVSNSNTDGRGTGLRELTRLTRRDSNTSTLSSYMSSIRSDSSPTFSLRNSRSDTSPPYQPRHARRRSADNNSSCSGSRQSIMNSPYEYDISGNLPNMSPGSDSNVGALATQIEGTKLDSAGHPDSPGVAGSAGSPCRFNRGRGISSFLSMSRCAASYEVTDPSVNPTGNRLMTGDGRRASDPVRCPVNGSSSSSSCHQADPNYQSLTDTKSEASQLHSSNAARFRKHHMSEQSLMSSRSSIATNFSMSFNQNPGADEGTMADLHSIPSVDGQINSMLHPDFTSVDDIIIPDEMQEFLENQKRDNEAADSANKNQNNSTPEKEDTSEPRNVSNPLSSCMFRQQQQQQGADCEATALTGGIWDRPSSQLTCGVPNANTNTVPLSNSSTINTSICSGNNNSNNIGNSTPKTNSQVTQMSDCGGHTQQTETVTTENSVLHSSQQFDNNANGAISQQNYPDHALSGSSQWPSNLRVNQFNQMNYDDYNFCQNLSQYQQYQRYWRMQRNGYMNSQVYRQQNFPPQWQQGPVHNRMPQRQHMYPEQHGMTAQHSAVSMGGASNQLQDCKLRSTNHEVQVPRVSQSQHSLHPCFNGELENTSSMENHPIGTYQSNGEYHNASNQFTNQIPSRQPSNFYSSRQNPGNMMTQGGHDSPPLNPWTQHYHMQSRNLQRYQGRFPSSNTARNPAGDNVQASGYPSNSGSMNLRVQPPNRSMLQMSPGCDKVSSTTDALPENSDLTGDQSQLESTLDSLCRENFIDNLTSISPEHESISPTELLMSSSSAMGPAVMHQSLNPTNMASCDLRASRMSGLLDTSNMIVTDMNSALSELVDDSKYHMF